MDFVYVPAHVASALFNGAASWESVESLVSLLTLCTIRDPVQHENGYSQYVVSRDDVEERFMETSGFQNLLFMLGDEPKPIIDRYESKFHRYQKKMMSFWVHDICDPKLHGKQHVLLEEYGTFPLHTWKMPRHVLIRWRYSMRIPVYKSNFSPAVDAPKAPEPLGTIEDVVEEFAGFSKMFFSIMCDCDESSIAYGFVCSFYFYIFDMILWSLRRGDVQPGLIEMFYRGYAIVKEEVALNRRANERPYALEGKFRSILPSSLYNFMPFSIYSPTRPECAKRMVGFPNITD